MKLFLYCCRWSLIEEGIGIGDGELIFEFNSFGVLELNLEVRKKEKLGFLKSFKCCFMMNFCWKSDDGYDSDYIEVYYMVVFLKCDFKWYKNKWKLFDYFFKLNLLFYSCDSLDLNIILNSF